MIHELGLYLGLQARCAESTPVHFGVRRATRRGNSAHRRDRRQINHPLPRAAGRPSCGSMPSWDRSPSTAGSAPTTDPASASNAISARLPGVPAITSSPCSKRRSTGRATTALAQAGEIDAILHRAQPLGAQHSGPRADARRPAQLEGQRAGLDRPKLRP